LFCPEILCVIFQALHKPEMLESGFVKAGSDLLSVFGGIVFSGLLEVSVLSGFLKFSDLINAMFGPVFEP
jgi:hypothetical protein